MKKRLLGIFVILFAMVSCGPTNVPQHNTDDDDEEEEIQPGDGYVDTLPTDPTKGVVLHAFDWKFTDIKDNLDLIKEAGYSIVQTSPVQQPKSGGARWEFFYQPVSFSIASNSPLGSKQDLKELCDAAEEKGILIICDIVFNHLATNGGKTIRNLPIVDAEVETYEQYIYQHQDECFHQYTLDDLRALNATSGLVTQYYDGLPDLNTGNSYVQERALALLDECIDVGVDGFRFDAAKHIETSQDPEFASSFWDNTLEVAKQHYTEKTGKNLYVYGEILNETDGGRSVDLYTRYMKVTDNQYIDSGVFNAVALPAHNASLAVNAAYGKSTADKVITWVESHDTYLHATDGNYPNRAIARIWPIVASRKDSTPLFFARPDSLLSVGKIGDYFFQDENVAIVNRFHNRFAEANEYQNAQDTTFYINERYTDSDQGALIIDLGSKKKGTISFTHLPDGYYFDQYTNKQVHIKNGKAKIDFSLSNMCVLTKTNNKLRAEASVSKTEPNYYKPFDLTITTKNATSASYSINNGTPVSFTNTATVKIGEGTNPGDSTTVKITYSNGAITSTKSFTYTKLDLVDNYFNVINFNKDYLDNYEVYLWTWSGGTSKYNQNYTYDTTRGTLLVSNPQQYDGFLITIFEKGKVIYDLNNWITPIKQTADIIPSQMEYFDAITFQEIGL